MNMESKFLSVKMNELRLGVIGAGGRGLLAREAHRPGRGARLVGAVDVNPEALADFRKFVNDADAFVTDDYRRLIEREDVDAVFVCSPDFLHEEHAVAALAAGKAVYLEKPMCITIAGCDRLLETAYRSGAKFYLGHNMRHFPVILKMKEIIDSGMIGEIQSVWCRHFVSYGGDAYFKDWHSERQYSTSLLLQKGAHDIDVIHWLSGGYTQTVVGMGRLSVYDRCERRDPATPGSAKWNVENWPPLSQKELSPVIDVEDHNMIMMSLDNGVQAAYLQCHYTPDGMRNYTFIGTEGRLENIGDSEYCKIEVYNKRSTEPIALPDVTFQMKPKTGTHGGADPDIVEEFIEFVRDAKPTNTSPVAARYSVAAGYLGAESLRNGCHARQIPPLDPKLRAYFENNQQR